MPPISANYDRFVCELLKCFAVELAPGKVSKILLEDTIRSNLEREFPDATIDLAVDGNRCLISVVTADFEGTLRVRREQRVYGCLKELLASGELHAVTIQAKTPEESRAD